MWRAVPVDLFFPVGFSSSRRLCLFGGFFLDRFNVVLAFLVLGGFVLAWWGQGQPMYSRITELSDGPSRLVVLTGQVRWVNGSWFQLCQGAVCLRVRVSGLADGSWKGRSVAVQGRFQSGTVWADAGGVDVLG